MQHVDTESTCTQRAHQRGPIAPPCRAHAELIQGAHADIAYGDLESTWRQSTWRQRENTQAQRAHADIESTCRHREHIER